MAKPDSVISTIVFSILGPLGERLHINLPPIDYDSIGELHETKELFDIQELHS